MSFKVNDWVRYTTAEGIKEIGMILSIDDNFIHIGINEIAYYLFDIEHPITFEHWKPEVGEWCWFYHTEYPMSYILAKFEHYGRVPYEQVDKYWAHTEFSDELEGFHYCEPFVNTTPSMIKGK